MNPLEPINLAPLKTRPTHSEQLAIGDGSPMLEPEGRESSGGFGFQNLIETKLTDDISLLSSIHQDSNQIW